MRNERRPSKPLTSERHRIEASLRHTGIMCAGMVLWAVVLIAISGLR